MSFQNPVRTSLATLFPATPSPRPWLRAPQLAGEALAFTLLSSLLPLALGLAESGLISLFLVAASLTDRFSILLEENRRNIYEVRIGSWRANRLTALSFLSLFLGILLGFALVAGALGGERIVRFFGFTLEAARLGDESLLEHSFGSPGAILAHNAGVLAAICVLAFLYRAYGAMLALTWNACIWAFVLSVLAARTASELDSPWLALAALAAVLPHLTLEGLAYILGSLAAIFASKGIASYGFGSPVLREILLVAALLLAIALGMLLLAALAESTLPALLAAR